MRLGPSYNLAFYGKHNIVDFIRDLFECEKVDKWKGLNGSKVFLGINDGKVTGVALVEKDEKDPKAYLVKAVWCDGEVKDYVVFTGEKIILPRNAY